MVPGERPGRKGHRDVVIILGFRGILEMTLPPPSSWGQGQALMTPHPLAPVTFKKMYQQKQKELLKQYEKQEKKLKEELRRAASPRSRR